jgi:hypothetical protein
VLFLTQVWGHSILRAGLELAPGPALAAVSAAVARRLGPRIGVAALGAIGGLLLATGMAITAMLLDATPDYVATFLPGQIIGGAGVGLAMPAFTAVAVAAVGPTHIATAIGISSMFRQVGAALGVAILVAILGTGATSTALSAFQHAWVFMAAAAAAGGALMLAAHRAPKHLAPALPVRQAA